MKLSKQKIEDNKVDEGVLLDERALYIEGVKVLQKQEKISYFLSLVISLVMVILLAIVFIMM